MKETRGYDGKLDRMLGKNIAELQAAGAVEDSEIRRQEESERCWEEVQKRLEDREREDARR